MSQAGLSSVQRHISAVTMLEQGIDSQLTLVENSASHRVQSAVTVLDSGHDGVSDSDDLSISDFGSDDPEPDVAHLLKWLTARFHTGAHAAIGMDAFYACQRVAEDLTGGDGILPPTAAISLIRTDWDRAVGDHMTKYAAALLWDFAAHTDLPSFAVGNCFTFAPAPEAMPALCSRPLRDTIRHDVRTWGFKPTNVGGVSCKFHMAFRNQPTFTSLYAEGRHCIATLPHVQSYAERAKYVTIALPCDGLSLGEYTALYVGGFTVYPPKEHTAFGVTVPVEWLSQVAVFVHRNLCGVTGWMHYHNKPVKLGVMEAYPTGMDSAACVTLSHPISPPRVEIIPPPWMGCFELAVSAPQSLALRLRRVKRVMLGPLVYDAMYSFTACGYLAIRDIDVVIRQPGSTSRFWRDLDHNSAEHVNSSVLYMQGRAVATAYCPIIDFPN